MVGCIHPDRVHPDRVHPDRVHPDRVHPARVHPRKDTAGPGTADRSRRDRCPTNCRRQPPLNPWLTGSSIQIVEPGCFQSVHLPAFFNLPLVW